MTTVATPPARVRRHAPATPRARLLAAAGVAAVVAILAASAWLRWSGQLPFGSDNDEYLLVAEQLARFEPPVVAGVEGTKYPLGYPALLAGADLAGLPPAPTALALNGLAIAATALLGALTVRRLGLPAIAAFAAAAYLAASPALWSSAYSVMPDALLTLAVAATVWWLARTRTPRDVAVLAALVAVATALKSVGVLLGLGVAAGLLLRPALRRVAWAPAVAGLAVVAGNAWAVAPFPPHTTGYGATFWLADPYDAAAGSVGVRTVLSRLWIRADLWFGDLGEAVTSPHAAGAVATGVGVALVVLGLVAFARRRSPALAPLAAAVAAYGGFLLLWPFESFRFGLPLLPVAAVGVALVAAALAGRRGAAGAAGVASVVAGAAAFAWWSGAQLAADARADAADLAALHRGTGAFAAWAEANIPPGDPIASFDYREVARRLDRPVLPLGYTSDLVALRDASAGRGAAWLVVVRDLYHRRERLADVLVASEPDRFQLVHDTERIDVYRIRPEAPR